MLWHFVLREIFKGTFYFWWDLQKLGFHFLFSCLWHLTSAFRSSSPYVIESLIYHKHLHVNYLGKIVSAGKSSAAYCLLFQEQKRDLINNYARIMSLQQNKLSALFCIFINLHFYLLTFLFLEDVHIHQKNPSLMFIKFTFHAISYAPLTLSFF